MRVESLQLVDFKRFDDLTIDLTSRPCKIIALVGPNGCGKSSVFDAFEELATQYKGRNSKPTAYYQKSLYDENPSSERYVFNQNILLKSDQKTYDRKSFYIRSAYRYTAQLNVQAIRKLESVEADQNRPQRLIDMDTRLAQNYERLLGQFYDDVYGQPVTGEEWAQKNVDAVNGVLRNVLDIAISSLGNPMTGEGSLYFEKGTSKKFPFENLSSGEKEVLDMVLDLYVKRSLYVNSIICIDEPELHLNTAIQRKLLREIERLVPDNSQLWVATHSIGFLRALQEDLWSKTAVVDFTGTDFDKKVHRIPIEGRRSDWLRIFETALEDLTGLMAPEHIIYCEGRADPSSSGGELGLDADVYNEVFASEHPEALFVSSGGGGAVKKNALVALKVLKKALTQVNFLVLRDRDELSDNERVAFLSENTYHRMLTRRELENYLFDREVLTAYCSTNGNEFNEASYNAAVIDIQKQDLKVVQQQIQNACEHAGDIASFKRDLAKHLKPNMAPFVELTNSIFP